MDAPEIRLKCLEFALTQAKGEGRHGEIDRVAEIATQFYTLVITEPDVVKPTQKGPKTKADKAPEIFK